MKLCGICDKPVWLWFLRPGARRLEFELHHHPRRLVLVATPDFEHPRCMRRFVRALVSERQLASTRLRLS